METIALCKDIAKPENYFSEITEHIIRLIPEVPYAMDKFYKYLVSVNLSTDQLQKIESYLSDQNKMIYGWQNYLIWKLLVSKSFSSQALVNFSKQIILTSDNIANKCGALLYLGKMGNSLDREFISKNFQKCNNFLLQRHALIALQELNWDTIKENIQDNVSEESIGIYKELRSYSIPRYLEPPRQVSYSDLIREISFYA